MKLLSILMSLVMMLSGGYVAEDPSTAASSVITIRDAIVTIDGEQYALNPSVVLGAASENGAALLDVGMHLGEDVLFPVQVKISESGLGLVIGQSDTVYTLTPAFFDEILGGEEIPDEITGMMESYGQLLSAMGNLNQASTLEQQKAAGEKFMELIGDAPAEEATFFANGAEQNGQHVAFTLSNDQMIEYMDFCFEQMPEGYAEAYFNYMNTTLTMVGMPEVNGFGDIFAMGGMEMSIDGEMTYNETSAAGEMVIHTVVDPSEIQIEAAESTDSEEIEPVSIDLPVEFTAHTPENAEYTMNMDVEGMQMILNGAMTEGAQMITMELAAEGEVIMNMDVSVLPVGETAMQFSFGMNMDVEGVSVSLGVNNTPVEGGSTTQCAFSAGDGEISFGAEFAIDLTHEAITDRAASATIAEINSSEDLESNTGLMMAAMSLMSGAEKLMNDESILALVEAVQSYTAVEEYEEPIEETPAATTEDDTPDAEGETVPSDATALEFAWLPEGYELTEVDNSSEYYTYYEIEYTNEDGEYRSTIYLDMESSATDSYPYVTYSFALTDEGAQRISEPVVTIKRYDDDSVTAEYVLNETTIFELSYYGSDLSDEDVVRILTGITVQ